MKSININVLLIAIIGLASGVFLLPDSLWTSESSSSDEPDTPASRQVENSQVVRTVEVIPVAAEPETANEEAVPDVKHELTLSVTGLKPKPSSVYVAVFDDASGFPRSESSKHTKVVSTTDNQVQLAVELPQDKPVAIAVFQDIDGDGKLSKNSIGIPTEPYGFSNNARGILGPPKFTEASFSISDRQAAAVPVEIRVR